MNPGQLVVDGALWIAIPIAALAGLVSFLSPCVLPLVPGYLGYLGGPLAVWTEGSDVLFASFQAAYLTLAYRRLDSLPAAVLGGAEEVLPGTDFVPTCTLYHIYVMRDRYGSDKTARPEIPEVERTDNDA